MTSTRYVTTTIPYVNAPPHIGFAVELVQADAIARYHRLIGSTVRFQTGTDENAFKNVVSARELGIPVQQLVDQNSDRFRALCDALTLSHDRFLRTTEPDHHRAVHAFLSRLRPEDVYQQVYRGLYCFGCEDFYQERDLDSGRRCPDHRAPAVEVEERNYFFRLSRYQRHVRDLIASRRLRIVPESRESEVLAFIDRGLTDISISRSAERSDGWGIPFPGEPGQVVYVWIDALVNYLTGLGYPRAADVDRFWGPDAARLHVIGKNVWKFHAVYWPALLLSAGLAVPNDLWVHGFLTHEGRKISKSDGNAQDPIEQVQRFGADAVRFFLLRHIHPFEDTDFSESRLAASYASDLSNGLGNLCSRLTALCEAAGLPGVARSSAPPVPVGYHAHIESFRLDLAIESLWAEVRSLNRALTQQRPWDDLRAGRREAACRSLAPLAERLDALACWLRPFLPATGTVIRTALSGSTIRKCAPPFPRQVSRSEIPSPG
ncbi:MAG: methionine--tRNA ligase [Gemmatimonadaceae bacterium]